MKLRHIYINKEGEPMGNPEMEYPEKPTKNMKSEDGMFEWTVYDGKVEKYHSGLLPFEDREEVMTVILLEQPIERAPEGPIKPDTLIPVDLEVEVVEQMGPRVKINDATEGAIPHKVLRIKN